jgi:uncharacterized membrane protein YfbV (UPF0208 family)
MIRKFVKVLKNALAYLTKFSTKTKKVYKIWPSKKRLNELFHNLSLISIGEMSFAKMPAIETAAMNGHATTWRQKSAADSS